MVREFGVTDPPPPPIFTLEDRADFSPISGVTDYSISPETKSEMRTLRDSHRDSNSPLRSKSEASTSFALVGGQQVQQTPTSSSWLSPTKSGSEHDKKGKGSPVEAWYNWRFNYASSTKGSCKVGVAGE
uniref:Uncharacterized protein n=1 Tax=Nelumbo nucifera TaxID=4432 RepID=A0A822Z8V6_NELNU|nr:TPA_asm: hypothetical protein HUJ06_015326 [Nelumbo nucifera]